MANQPTTKMLICSWKGCEDFVFEDTVAFQEHMVKHGQEQMQPSTLKNGQKDADTEKEEELMAKKAKQNEADGNGRRKVIFMAIEVWVDVFGFIKRIQLARTISLTSRLIHQICWPRLHGNKVKARTVWKFVIGSRIESEGRPPTALTQLSDGTEMPLVSWPPPEYISEFRKIIINFLDQEVVELLTHIFPCINSKIIMDLNLKELDEEHCANIGQLLNCFGKGLLARFNVHINSPIMVDRIEMLHEIEKAGPIKYCIKDKSGIPIVMKILETPTANGQQREFRASTQPFPQPFYIVFGMYVNVDIDEENQQTDEILRSFNVTNPFHGPFFNWNWVICRHPKGQHEQLVEDGRKRLNLNSILLVGEYTGMRWTSVIVNF